LATVAIAAGLAPSAAAGAEIVHVTPTLLPEDSGFTALADGPGCDDGHACIWGKTNYNGQKNVFGSSWAGTWWYFGDFNRNSAKNRFGNRKFKLGRYFGGNNIVVISCLDPGENRPDPGWFNSFHISDAGAGNCGSG
jgi:hypothetical protein